MKIQVFTDGSSNIHKDNYESSSAIIICVDKKEFYKCGTYHKGGTNSKGEVYAIKYAYDKLYELFNPNKLTDVEIISDSDYVVKSVTNWIYGWVRNRWKTASNSEVKFSDVFKYLYDKYLDRKIRNKNIHVYHINSHIKNIKKLKSARRKFCAKNDIDISDSDFEFLVKYNNEVDKLANYIRVNKLENYEEVLHEWGRKVNTRNGKIVIKSLRKKSLEQDEN